MPKSKKLVGDSWEQGRDNMRRSEDMDQALLNAFVDEVHKGNGIDGSWTPDAYRNVVQMLRTVIGPHITKQHIKNRMKTLKDNFNEAFDLFNGLSGFAWNPITKKFEAEEEVWKDFIKEKSYAIKWKRYQFRNYDIMKDLFGADRATGKHAKTAKDRLKRWEKEKQSIDLNDAFEDMRMHDTEVHSVEENPFSPLPLKPLVLLMYNLTNLLAHQV